jgi:hypothetical protein
VGGGGGIEMKMREYGWWASCTYMKKNDETFCNCFKWGKKGVGEDMVGTS